MTATRLDKEVEAEVLMVNLVVEAATLLVAEGTLNIDPHNQVLVSVMYVAVLDTQP